MSLLALLIACSPTETADAGPAAEADADADADTDADTDADADAARCDPVAELPVVHYLEGDAIAFSFQCASGADRSQFTAALSTLADGPAFDPATWVATWQTGLADGGRHELALSVTGPGGALETAIATLWIADDGSNPGNVPVSPAAYTEEWGLPVVHVQSSGAISDSYVAATITFYGEQYVGQVKKRGASSYYYTKGSYTLRFPDEDLDADAVGMGNKDHLVLISPFDDNSYVRQKLAYDLWAEIADYWGEQRLTPRTFFAVLYLDGSYYGLYTAIDRVDEHFLEEMGFEREANLYMAVNHDGNFYATNASGYAKSTLHDGYEKEEGDPSDFSDIDALVGFTSTAAASSFVEQSGEWLDLEEFMDWLLFVHYIEAGDSGGKNSFLYNADVADPYFRYAPWDFNHSFGQGWYTYRISADSYNDFRWNNRVFDLIQSDPAANAQLWARFAELAADGPLNDAWLTAQLDSYYAQIGPSAARDWQAWAGAYDAYFGDSNGNSYPQEKAYLYQWLLDRHAAMLAYHPAQ